MFVSERGGPVTTGWFRKMMARLGVKADMPFPIHPHQLRHSCGYKYANEGKDTRSLQAYLGHRSINSTVRYTMMSNPVQGVGEGVNAKNPPRGFLMASRG